MRPAHALFAVTLLAAWPALAQQPDAREEARATGQVETPDSLRRAVRTDKRGLVERNMQLTAQEAAKFWPIYDAYQQQLDRLAERENRAILDYINAENTMTDANAKRIARELLKAEEDEQSLRQKQFRRMLGVLPARKAVRYLQIENKIRTLQRYDIAEHLTLVR